MSLESIYLDHNSTAPLHPEVAKAIAQCYGRLHGNPASPHCFGRKARRMLEEAREGISQLLGADPYADAVIFTSGGTEANNLAILGLVGAEPVRVIVSAIEHPSVLAPARHLRRRAYDVQWLRVSAEGVVDLDQLRRLLAAGTRLVSVMLGNHETGVLQPVAEVADICRRASAVLHSDAVQVIGKQPVDFRALGVSAMSVSAHKFHGPVGIGALVLRGGTQLEPVLHGGFQQQGLRPGTEPVALAVGMLRALQIAQCQADNRPGQLRALRDRFEHRLRSSLPEITINGVGAARLPQTANISFPGLDRQALLMALDQAGVACSAGSACASGSTDPSPVLLAMGCPEPVVRGSLRFSLGGTTTAGDIDRAVDRILEVVNGLRGEKTRREVSSASRGPAPKSL